VTRVARRRSHDLSGSGREIDTSKVRKFHARHEISEVVVLGFGRARVGRSSLNRVDRLDGEGVIITVLVGVITRASTPPVRPPLVSDGAGQAARSRSLVHPCWRSGSDRAVTITRRPGRRRLHHERTSRRCSFVRRDGSRYCLVAASPPQSCLFEEGRRACGVDWRTTPLAMGPTGLRNPVGQATRHLGCSPRHSSAVSGVFGGWSPSAGGLHIRGFRVNRG
jgi:hypothetical protein